MRDPHTRRTVAGLVVAIVVAVLVIGTALVVLSLRSTQDPTDVRAAPTTAVDPTTTTIPDSARLDAARTAWASIVPTLSTTTVTGPFELVAGIPTVATGDGGSTSSSGTALVTIWEFRGVGWSPVSKVVTGLPTSSFEFRDATGDGVSEVLATGIAARPVTFVFGRTDGTWRLVPWGTSRSDSSAGQLLFDATGRMSTVGSTCVPDCASGSTVVTHWVFDPTSGSFVRS